jgi:hypothetical protein
MPDIEYNRPGRARQYLHRMKHHRNANNNYSKWISNQIEQSTFDAADYGNHQNRPDDPEWLDDNGNLWGFLQDFADVGLDREQFGFFPCPQNVQDRWHGYPIIPFKRDRESNKYNISNNLLDLWMDIRICRSRGRPGVRMSSSAGEVSIERS